MTEPLDTLFSLLDEALDSIDRSEAVFDRLLLRALRRIQSPEDAAKLVDYLPGDHPYLPLFKALYDELRQNSPAVPDYQLSN